MIHYKREGRPLALGLNITVGTNKRWWPWITFIWAWYNIPTHRLTVWRLRFRTWKPAVFFGEVGGDVIENYLRNRDERLIKRELIEDLRLHAFLHKDATLDGLLNRYRLPEGF